MPTGVILFWAKGAIPDFGLWGQINLAAGVIRARVFHALIEMTPPNENP